MLNTIRKESNELYTEGIGRINFGTMGRLGTMLQIMSKQHNAFKLNTREVKNKMEVKSRYEVVSDLEEKKREYIREKDHLDKRVLVLKKEQKEIERILEDKKEEIKEFNESLKSDKETIDTLIKSVDESLKRFSELGSKK